MIQLANPFKAKEVDPAELSVDAEQKCTPLADQTKPEQPAVRGGKHLCADVAPVPEATILRLKKAMWLLPGSSIKVEADSELFDGMTVRHCKSFFPIPGKEMKTEYVLLDKNQDLIALCSQGSYKQSKFFTIYGRTPLYESDMYTSIQHGGTKDQPSTTFYPWFRVRDVGEASVLYRPVRIWNGKTFEPLYRASASKQNGLSSILNKEDIVISSKEQDIGHLTRSSEGLEVSIEANTDPVMMICLAIVLDDLEATTSLFRSPSL